MLKVFTFLCFVAGVFAGTVPYVSHRLETRIPDGGLYVDISKYPYAISLQYSGSHICGGSIISQQWVLTAAHCMVYSIAGYTVRAGGTERDTGGIVYSVSSVTKHPDYDSRTYDYDIAVIQISGSFMYDTNVQPVALATLDPETDTKAEIVGWATTSSSSSIATRLQVISLPVVSHSQCDTNYGIGSITDRMICAGYAAGGRDFCQGHSGGPLTGSGAQVGIASWGYGCARPNYPGVYTSVANLRSWIYETTGV